MSVALVFLVGIGVVGYLIRQNKSLDSLQQYDEDPTTYYGNPSHNPELQAYWDSHQYDPNRYDNLPMVQSAYREPHTALTSALDNPMEQFHYGRQQDASQQSYFQRQYTTLTDEHPLQLGALPEVRKGTGTRLPDPVSGMVLKPPKREVMMEEIRVPEPTTIYNRNQSTNIIPRLHQKIQEESMLTRGHGALDGYSLSGDHMARGFATGEIMERRTGTVGRGGNRERIHRQDEMRRGRNQHGFDPRPARDQAIAPAFSVWSNGTHPLGELRLNENSDVREWSREPVPTRGVSEKPGLWYDEVVLKHTNRDMGYGYGQDGVNRNTEVDYRGVAGMPAGYGMPERREINMYTRPKDMVDFDMSQYRVPGAFNTSAAYINQNWARDLSDRMTNRTLDEQPMEYEVDWAPSYAG